MALPCFRIEREFAGPLAGVDEAGCAPLAGPVVAAAVILDRRRFPRGIDDSKKLAEPRREALYAKLQLAQTQGVARIGVGIVSVEEIDELNILWARMLAMVRAVEALGIVPAMVLVDGNRCPNWDHTSQAIVAGDTKCRSIAAASIIAKVTRDRIMADHARSHPGYGWERNRGYPTPEHIRALDTHGLTALHRRTFAPVRERLARGAQGDVRFEIAAPSPLGHTTTA